MSGVSWTERQPSDWLASNGRWYPASQRPSNWQFLSLPPAPGHGSVNYREFRTSNGSPSTNEPPKSARPRQHRVRPSQSPPRSSGRNSTEPSTSTAVTPTGRRVEDATVTEISATKRRIAPGQTAAGQLPPPTRPKTPPPPGRVAPPSPGRARTQLSAVAKTATSSTARDLGSVLGQARKKIETAINEAAEK